MKKKLVAIAAAAVAMIPIIGSPANAAAAAGTLKFECVAALPEFPSPQAEGTCGSNTLGIGGPVVPSSATGVIKGATDANQPIVLVAAGTNNFSAAFTYQEPCVANEPPASGTANGKATITGLQGVVGTTQVNNGTLVVDFEWVRGGATAAILITDAVLTTSQGTVDGVTVVGAGAANFAPLLGATNVCPVGGPIRAVVEGSASVVASD